MGATAFQKGLGAVHSISHPVGAFYNTHHGLTNAIVLPLTGWIANFFGRKRLLLWSVAGFTVASFLCGLAPNLELLILFRVIQGLTGGAL